ncbi:MAG: DUF4350 domain-containing protein [Desulfitobacteriaceae bacterium]
MLLSSKQKNWILFTFAIFVSLFLSLPSKVVLAAPGDENQSPPIIIKAQGSYGNFTRQGSWLPLEVEVTNQGKDLQGYLRVVANDNHPELAGLDYVSSTVIPQGSTKAFNFYIPVQEYLTGLKIELVSGDQVIAQQTLQLTSLSNNQLVIGLLDRTEEGLSSLNGLKQTDWLTPNFITLKNEKLPVKAEQLNLFDILVIDNIDLKLTQEQATALTHWVSRGGTLIVGGGSGWQKIYPQLPQELQVVTVSGVESKNLSSLPRSLSEPVSKAIIGPVRIANIQSDKGKPLYPEQGQPLAVDYQFGDGKVLYLAFDPALEPISNWPGTKVFWQDLVMSGKSSAADSQVMGRSGMVSSKMIAKYGSFGSGLRGQQNNAWGFADALGNIEDMALPPLWIMSIIIGIYLLLAGLINYLVLKKLDKREWTWINVPAIAIIFVLLIYLTSLKTRPDEVISHQITAVEIKPGTSLAKVTTVTGLFAPNHTKYNLQLPGRHLVGPLHNTDIGMGINSHTIQKLNANISVEHTPEQTNLEFRQMRSWVMRGFYTVEDASLTGSINCEIIFKDNKWLATITNSTQYNFTDGVIISLPNWFVKINALKAGEKTQTEIKLNITNNNFGPSLADQIYNPQFNWQGPGVPPSPKPKDMIRQQILQSQIGYREDYGNGAKMLFFGWSDEPIQGGLKIEDKVVKKYYTTLIQVPLNLQFDTEHLEVPEGLITGTLFSSRNVDFGPPGMVIMRADSEAIYQLELPEGKFKEMQLNTHQSNRGSYSGMSGYLYNWETANWEDVSVTSDNTVIKDPFKFVNGDRLVRFKATCQAQSQQAQPQQPELEFFGVSVSLSSKGGGQ